MITRSTSAILILVSRSAVGQMKFVSGNCKLHIDGLGANHSCLQAECSTLQPQLAQRPTSKLSTKSSVNALRMMCSFCVYVHVVLQVIGSVVSYTCVPSVQCL